MESQMGPEKRFIVELNQVSFQYPGSGQPALKDVGFKLAPGEAVLLTGPTGCGKSTLLKVISGIIPLESSGQFKGKVRLAGKQTSLWTLPQLAPLVGLVYQSPDDQLFSNTVYDEVALGPINLGLGRKEIKARVDEALGQVGLFDLKNSQVNRLSGGQKQRLAIASQLAMRPLVMALDEPISQLDQKGAREVLNCLKDLVKAGMALIIVEHRIEEAMTLVNRVLVMDKGRLVDAFDKARLPAHAAGLEELGLEVPEAVTLAQSMGMVLGPDWQGDFESMLAGIASKRPTNSPLPAKTPRQCVSVPLLRMEDVCFRYFKGGPAALSGVSLTVCPNEVVALMGVNGSGKSTLLSLMAGLNHPGKGQVFWQNHRLKKNRPIPAGRTGMLFQNPDLLLIETSVEEEFGFGPGNQKKSSDEIKKLVTRTAQEMGLTDQLATPPWALSKGQRLRAALGSLLTMQPGLLLLDEPTTGQNKKNITGLLKSIQANASVKAVVFCSHDLASVAEFSTRVILLDQGRIVAQGPSGEILQDRDALTQCGLKPPKACLLSTKYGFSPPAFTASGFAARMKEVKGKSRAS